MSNLEFPAKIPLDPTKPEPVLRSLVIGAGRHFGLGLLAAVE